MSQSASGEVMQTTVCKYCIILYTPDTNTCIHCKVYVIHSIILSTQDNNIIVKYICDSHTTVPCVMLSYGTKNISLQVQASIHCRRCGLCFAMYLSSCSQKMLRMALSRWRIWRSTSMTWTAHFCTLLSHGSILHFK